MLYHRIRLSEFYKVFVIIGILIVILLNSLTIFAIYHNLNKVSVDLVGNTSLIANINEDYNDPGIIVNRHGREVKYDVKESNNIDTTQFGNYTYEYEITVDGKKYKLVRNVEVVDNSLPVIKVDAKEVIRDFCSKAISDEPTYKATDNYDGDITDKVEIDSKVNTNELGDYVVNYKVRDSSGNEATTQRTVRVIKRPIVHRDGVAVLNYHFFYGGASSCGINCININKFEEQLKYLKENGYKALSMDEFTKWMYGEINVPEKSVLITIDDGAQGTGKQNGNLLIPMLEKYQTHATLFLITGWWSINNYKSNYLDVESHTNDMHSENQCQGVQRGAKMLCLPYEDVVKDLKKSIEITGSNKAFCFPFYVYNEQSVNAVKEAGFKLGFVGGNYKATRSSNKYLIPRFHIYDSITMDEFISYIA